jgi:hypothetical protein
MHIRKSVSSAHQNCAAVQKLKEDMKANDGNPWEECTAKATPESYSKIIQKTTIKRQKTTNEKSDAKKRNVPERTYGIMSEPPRTSAGGKPMHSSDIPCCNTWSVCIVDTSQIDVGIPPTCRTRSRRIAGCPLLSRPFGTGSS